MYKVYFTYEDRSRELIVSTTDREEAYDYFDGADCYGADKAVLYYNTLIIDKWSIFVNNLCLN